MRHLFETDAHHPDADARRSGTGLGRRLARLLGAAALAATLAACGGSEGADSQGQRQQIQSTTSLAEGAALADPSNTGAIYSSDSSCAVVNANLFALKSDVYLDGGPKSASSPGLPNGNYWAQVTDPSGATLLGYTQQASVRVQGGQIVGCLQLVAILTKPSDSTAGYDTTPNGGGVYKLWVAFANTDNPAAAFDAAQFVGSNVKTDNFKVLADECQPGSPGCTPEPTGTLEVVKYYDANANGVKDTGEVLLEGWKLLIRTPDAVDLIGWTTYNALGKTGTYTVDEAMPLETNWIATDPGPKEAKVEPDTVTRVAFGNVCLGAGGGLTLGFWSNKNGQSLIDSGDLALLVAMNLRNANGSEYNPPNKTDLRNWLLNGTAVNMAYMLSVQAAAMKLNVANGKVSGTALVYVGKDFGFPGLSSLGFASINDLLAAANASLAVDAYTTAGHPQRRYQEFLKNALDAANNNRNFVQATACPYTF